jgi:glycosyltransferase involved in cell wall biosynthesis
MRSDPTVLSPSEMRTELKRASEENAVLARRLAELSTELAATRRDYTRLRSRRVVRVSLAVARPFKPLFALVRGGGGRSLRRSEDPKGVKKDPRSDEGVVPYLHIASATDGSQPSAQTVHGDPVSPSSASRVSETSGAHIRLGLFVPASGTTFPASTHVRVLRRFYHPSVEKYLSPVVLDAERYLTSQSVPHLDVALVQRTGVPAALTDDFLHRMDEQGIPIVLDLDDDLISMPDSHPDFDAFREWRQPLEALAKRAYMITASTEPLRERLRAYNDNVFTLTNALDRGLWFSSSPDRDGDASHRDAGQFRLLYFGSRTHGGDIRLLEEFVRRPGNDTTMTVVGGAPTGTLDWCDHVGPPRASREYPSFVPWLRRFATGFDALVAPLVDTAFNEAKSDLKFLEGTALGLPVICSDVSAFAGLRDRGVARLVGPNPDEWGEAITLFRRGPELRSEFLAAADVYVRSERLLEQQAPDLLRLFADVSRKATV